MDITVQNFRYLNHDTFVDSYLDEIRKYPVLTKEEEYELIKKAKSGDKEAKDYLINCNLKFVFSIAKLYSVDDRLMDIVNEGNIGLIECIDMFDMSKGTKFITYAVWYIRRKISAYIINSGFIKKTMGPKLTYHNKKLKNRFFGEHGRFPSDEELIELFDKEYGISVTNPSYLYDIQIISANTVYDDNDENTFEVSSEYIEHTKEDNDFELFIEKEENNYIVNKYLSILKERDSNIVKMAFGIGCEPKSHEEIAEIYGFTKERIRQICSNSIKLMKKATTAKAF